MRRKDSVRRDSAGREIEGPPDTRAAQLLVAARRRTLQYQLEVAEKAGVGSSAKELFVDVSVATMMKRRLFATELEGLLGFPVRVTPVAPDERDELRGWTVRLDQDQGRAERSDQ